jgi:hypothetical protein
VQDVPHLRGGGAPGAGIGHAEGQRQADRRIGIVASGRRGLAKLRKKAQGEFKQLTGQRRLFGFGGLEGGAGKIRQSTVCFRRFGIRAVGKGVRRCGIAGSRLAFRSGSGRGILAATSSRARARACAAAWISSASARARHAGGRIHLGTAFAPTAAGTQNATPERQYQDTWERYRSDHGLPPESCVEDSPTREEAHFLSKAPRRYRQRRQVSTSVAR